MDTWTIHEILSYVDVDTQLVLSNTSKKYSKNVENMDVYKCGSMRLVKSHISTNRLQIDSHSTDTSGIYNMSVYKNNEHIVMWMLPKSVQNHCWEIVFRNACAHGWINVVKYMISVGACYVLGGLEKACQFGPIEIVKILLPLAYEWNNWDQVLAHACCRGQEIRGPSLGQYTIPKEGRREILELVIGQGKSKNCYTCNKPVSEHLK